MVFFKILGQPFLVLGSVSRTYDLFEKRSSNYSDRPRVPMINEVLIIFPLFMLSRAHHKPGWNIHGTCLSIDTARSGGATAVPSMIISIQTWLISTIQSRSPPPESFFVACSSLQMTSCFISDSKCTSYSEQ